MSRATQIARARDEITLQVAKWKRAYDYYDTCREKYGAGSEQAHTAETVSVYLHQSLEGMETIAVMLGAILPVECKTAAGRAAQAA